MKKKQVSLNIPVILTFDDYHEIKYVQEYFNQLVKGKKIKSKELAYIDAYAAIFYFTQDDEYKHLVKEHKHLSESFDYES